MSNRRFEMYEYRQVIYRMRLGESDRAIAKAGLTGRRKAAELRQLLPTVKVRIIHKFQQNRIMFFNTHMTYGTVIAPI